MGGRGSGRRPDVAGGRQVTISFRVSADEAAALDELRRHETRTAYMRRLLRAKIQDMRDAPIAP